MGAFKVGRRVVMLGSAVVAAVGLSIGLGGTAGAGTDANIVTARTQGDFALTFGSGVPYQASVGTTAVNVSFRVNGQGYGQGGFSVPAEEGPYVVDPSSANASSSDCQGCLTNAIAITVDVVTGPASVVEAPTYAVATDNYCVGCNTLAADYTFVVAPGTAAALTPAGLSDLYAIASQVVDDAHSDEPSPVLADQVASALGEIQGVLQNPADLDPNGSAQLAAVPQLQPRAGVQEFGETQYATAVSG